MKEGWGGRVGRDEVVGGLVEGEGGGGGDIFFSRCVS